MRSPGWPSLGPALGLLGRLLLLVLGVPPRPRELHPSGLLSMWSRLFRSGRPRRRDPQAFRHRRCLGPRTMLCLCPFVDSPWRRLHPCCFFFFFVSSICCSRLTRVPLCLHHVVRFLVKGGALCRLHPGRHFLAKAVRRPPRPGHRHEGQEDQTPCSGSNHGVSRSSAIGRQCPVSPLGLACLEVLCSGHLNAPNRHLALSLNAVLVPKVSLWLHFAYRLTCSCMVSMSLRAAMWL